MPLLSERRTYFSAESKMMESRDPTITSTLAKPKQANSKQANSKQAKLKKKKFILVKKVEPKDTALGILDMPQKFKDGESARKKWGKELDDNNTKFLSVEDFTKGRTIVEGSEGFIKFGDIVLDNSKTRQTTIMVKPCTELWNKRGEHIYLFVYNNKIAKIGGTRTSMKERFGSYLCGHHVPERGKSGKMSVTNAHIYHTIEETLLKNHKWELWACWLPVKIVTETVMEETVEYQAQRYHKIESFIIKSYKKITGHYPILSDNCDPSVDLS